MADLTLTVTRQIPATPQRVFDAWTRPELLTQWWGPAGVICPEASVDLRVGGAYAIANETPIGTVWIRGEFVEIEDPGRLVYTWSIDGAPGGTERVTVTFTARDGGTFVEVLHEHIGSPEAVVEHTAGWEGCLDGLVELSSAL